MHSTHALVILLQWLVGTTSLSCCSFSLLCSWTTVQASVAGAVTSLWLNNDLYSFFFIVHTCEVVWYLEIYITHYSLCKCITKLNKKFSISKNVILLLISLYLSLLFSPGLEKVKGRLLHFYLKHSGGKMCLICMKPSFQWAGTGAWHCCVWCHYILTVYLPQNIYVCTFAFYT